MKIYSAKYIGLILFTLASYTNNPVTTSDLDSFLNTKTVPIISLVIGFFVLCIILWNTVLQNQVKVKTRELTNIVTELKKSQETLKASEGTFRALFENSSDPMIILDNSTFIDCNKALHELLGYSSKHEILGKAPWDLSPEKQLNGGISRAETYERIHEALEYGKSRFEWLHSRKDGSTVLVEVVLTLICLNNRNVLHGIYRDISERKELENRLEFLSYHDQLTGLYNRRFFEAELQRLDVPRNYPLTIVMADVNGLKLINDSFGHKTGDELLVDVAKEISRGCRADDIIARLGGDEFVILLPQTKQHEAEKVIRRIKSHTSKQKIQQINISVSYGWETKYDPSQSIVEIMKKAEDSMYKNKLFESPSVRSRAIITIINTLNEKDKREEAHSIRVSQICEKFGQALQMPEEQVQELKSLGLLHDIGKVALDDQLLNKVGQFTIEEYEDIKRHSEIGCRILAAVIELAELSEYVLAHHERWDGDGYPKQLKDNDIPLPSRIVAIADAYDAMTSERSYHDLFTKQQAIDEILKNSGTQFDPQLAKLFIEKVVEDL